MNSILQILVDNESKNSVSGVKVEYLLKSQESRLKTFNENVEKRYEDRMDTQSRNFDHELLKLRDVAKEHLEIFKKQVFDTKASHEHQVNKLRTLMDKEVKN